jgi:hypothetical protein
MDLQGTETTWERNDEADPVFFALCALLLSSDFEEE